MEIYSFHPQTGVYQGADVADPDPMRRNEFLIPAFCTTAPPPVARPGTVAVFRDGGWTLMIVKTASAAKAEKVAALKALVRRVLADTDHVWQRHQEQRELGVTPSLDDEALRAILHDRQELRARANRLEQEIMSLPDEVGIVEAFRLAL